MSIAFLVTTVLVAAMPGTGVVYTLSASLSGGRRAGIIAAAGCTLGMVPHLLATVTGLAALISASPAAFQVLKDLGVAYLLYLAVVTLRDRGGIGVAADAGPRSAGRIITSAILVNLLNPKLTVFFLAFLPQFAGDGDMVTTVSLGGIAMLVTLAVFTAYAILAGSARTYLASGATAHAHRAPVALTWLRRLIAVSFVGLGLKLALTTP